MLNSLTGWINIFPPPATELAKDLDTLSRFLIAVSVLSAILVIAGFVYFSIRFRRRSERESTPKITHHYLLEFLWSFIPFVIFMFIFAWGWWLYARLREMPHSTLKPLEVHVYGQKWNWDFVYKNGRKTTSLYVPLGRPVKLIMTSRDVIHSFYVPAFRIKQDVLPGVYTALSFTAGTLGKFYVFCTEFCGTGHSGMQTKIHVMEQKKWDQWLLKDPYKGLTLREIGKKVFQGRCTACHLPTLERKIGPGLAGVFGTKRIFQNGESLVADENYIRESILNPAARIVKGFDTQMTPFQGLLQEEELTGLIEYIKSLTGEKHDKLLK